MKIFMSVVGTRPNFMKAAPVIKALKIKNVGHILVHTGQHYDSNMSDIFFDQLNMPKPDFNLGIGSGSHAQQTAEIMVHFEKILLDHKPECLIVYGDVNSTMAATIVAVKLGIRVAHVEAGLRSFDRMMPEEINRLVTDQIADLLFTPSVDGDNNLIHEGISPSKIHLVGNVMIDTLIELLPKAEKEWPRMKKEYALDEYILVTLHRPSNVDDGEMLANIIEILEIIANDIKVLFPIHPRTRKKLIEHNIGSSNKIHFIEPQGYLEFLTLQNHVKALITDSGGIQEETTYLGIPCLTIRKNTERPITIDIGTNILIGDDMGKLYNELELILSGKSKKGKIPELWDGKASERIADVLIQQ